MGVVNGWSLLIHTWADRTLVLLLDCSGPSLRLSLSSSSEISRASSRTSTGVPRDLGGIVGVWLLEETRSWGGVCEGEGEGKGEGVADLLRLNLLSPKSVSSWKSNINRREETVLPVLKKKVKKVFLGTHSRVLV